MRKARIIGGIAVVGMVVFFAWMIFLVFAGTAQGHSSYCGHGTYIFWIHYPNAPSQKFREVYRFGWGSGPHQHQYNVFRYDPSGFVHEHSRWCPSHAA